MSASKEIATIRGTVQQLLEADEMYRDSDSKLWARIVAKYLRGEGLSLEMTAYDLLCMLANGKLPSFESCSRARREIQNEFPHLRGTKYQERLKEMERVQVELGYKIDLH